MAPAPRPDYAGRLDALHAALPRLGADALVVSSPENIAYLTNFTGSSGLLVVAPDRRWLLIDGRYEFTARGQLSKGTLPMLTLERVEQRYDLTLASLVTREAFSRVAFEAGAITVATLGAWQRAMPPVTWVPTERLIEDRRLIKDAAEQAIYRRGGALIAGVAEGLRQIVRQGKRERDIASAVETALLRAGFERLAFPTIVASGPNSAHPHARPGDRRLAAGDLVVLDFGGVIDGYCLDLTRMAAVEPVAPQAHALYAAVRAAQAAALAAVRPGVQSSAIDAAARSVLESRGFGPAFVHATGHGLGLEIHEAPRVARAETGASQGLEAGMIFSIEPGAYVEGVGGVRLEDDVIVTEEGCEVLTEASRDLLLV